MSVNKEKIIGITGTAIFAVLFFLILFFSYLKIIAPDNELGGIPVMFGNVPDAGGTMESPHSETVSHVTEALSSSVKAVEEPLITQKTESTIDVKAQREEDKKRRDQQELLRAQEEVKRRQQEAENRRRIDQQMSGLFGENTSNRGTTQGSGTQGVATGNASQGASTGIGGVGHTYDLGGRGVGPGGLVEPSYSANDYGKVVINITVDPRGNVINAVIGRGTNTPDNTLRNEALRAARRTKFVEINSVNNQKGTITYNFKLLTN